MKLFETKWWSLTLPTDSTIETKRDYVSISVPSLYKMTVTFLRGNISDTTANDLEKYAHPFEKEMSERKSVAENGWTGFTFFHQDSRHETGTHRGYFAKQRYLLILTIEPEKGAESSCKDLFVSTLRNLNIRQIQP